MSRVILVGLLSLGLLPHASALAADVPIGKQPPVADARPSPEVTAAVAVGRKLRNDGNDAAALKAFDDALAKARFAKDQAGEALALNNLASVYRYQAGLTTITANQAPAADLVDQAARHYEQALTAAKAAGNRFDAAYAQLYLGVLAAGRGDSVLAFRRYEEAFTTFNALDDRYYLARTQMFKGQTDLYRRQRPKESLQHFEQALALYREAQIWQEAQVVLRDMAVAYDRLQAQARPPQ
jgi:tetratricopeptide (TPR) repeat protein